MWKTQGSTETDNTRCHGNWCDTTRHVSTWSLYHEDYFSLCKSISHCLSRDFFLYCTVKGKVCRLFKISEQRNPRESGNSWEGGRGGVQIPTFFHVKFERSILTHCETSLWRLVVYCVDTLWRKTLIPTSSTLKTNLEINLIYNYRVETRG